MGSPCCAGAPSTHLAAEVAGIAMGLTQAGVGLLRGAVEGLLWSGCGPCAPAACGGRHSCCQCCAVHRYVFECYPSLPCGGCGGCGCRC